jgi:hypothetical protein
MRSAGSPSPSVGLGVLELLKCALQCASWAIAVSQYPGRRPRYALAWRIPTVWFLFRERHVRLLGWRENVLFPPGRVDTRVRGLGVDNRWATVESHENKSSPSPICRPRCTRPAAILHCSRNTLRAGCVPWLIGGATVEKNLRHSSPEVGDSDPRSAHGEKSATRIALPPYYCVHASRSQIGKPARSRVGVGVQGPVRNRQDPGCQWHCG